MIGDERSHHAAVPVATSDGITPEVLQLAARNHGTRCSACPSSSRRRGGEPGNLAGRERAPATRRRSIRSVLVLLEVVEV